jgi:MOSC domain-containing protein YiiM
VPSFKIAEYCRSTGKHMHLEAILTGEARPIASKSGLSGIFKQPRQGPVRIGSLGLEGDTIVDTQNHGGLDQAVYVFTRPDLDWWSEQLGTTLPAGTFGENTVLSELESAAMQVGDRLSFGDVVLEVTSPRVPCATLAVRMGDARFLKAFHQALRPGFYCRVLQSGKVEAGMAAHHMRFVGPTVTVAEMLRHYPFAKAPEDFLERLLASPAHKGAIAYVKAMRAAQ